MILYEDMKPIERVLLHPICVLSHLIYLLHTLKLLVNISLQKKKQIKRDFSSLNQQGRN